MKPPFILAIEDNHELAESLEDIFSMQGYRAHIAKTGSEGLTYALENRPDLIILDIRLPDMSGYEVYNRLKEDVWGRTAKVMVLTASELIENIANITGLPLEYILFKPDTSIEKLLSVIKTRLEQ